jgi:hypothetical protein
MGKPRRAVQQPPPLSPILSSTTPEGAALFDDDAFDSFLALTGGGGPEGGCAEQELFSPEPLLQPPLQSCTCYLVALQSLAQLERVSHPAGDIAFDVVLTLVREALHHSFPVVVECARCLASSSCLLVLSLLVAKIVLLCRAGCEAYGIGGEEQQSAGIRCTAIAVRVGNYEVRGEEERVLVSGLIQRRMREIEEILAKLNSAAQKLPQDGQSNACREVVADAFQKLQLTTGGSGMG